MTSTTLTIRLPLKLARQLQAKAKAAKSNPSAILRRAAENYVSERSAGKNALQEHIAARAGKWEGYLSGEELLRRTRP